MKNYNKSSKELYNYDLWLSSSDLLNNGIKYTGVFGASPLQVIQFSQIDLNSDGLEDLFYYSDYLLTQTIPNPPPVIFINRGLFLEETDWTGPTLRNPHGVKIIIGDYNNDGLADLFSLVAIDPAFGAFPDLMDFNNLLINSPSGFNQIREFSDQRGFWGAGASGDINNDGNLDIIMFNFHVGHNNVTSKILWNDGQANFTYDDRGIGNIPVVDVAELVDVNNDGYLDLVLDHINFGLNLTRIPTINIMWGNGLGFSLDRSAEFILRGNQFLSDLNFYDIDSDGVKEIFLSGDSGDGSGYWIDIYKSDDNGKTFSNRTGTYFDTNAITQRFDHLRVQDIDLNGRLDIFSPDRSENIRWEWNGSRFIRANAPLADQVVITGHSNPGETLATYNTISNFGPSRSLAYHWEESADGVNWTSLGQDFFLSLGDSQLGHTIRVRAEYTDANGVARSITSNATIKIAATTIVGSAGHDMLKGTAYADLISAGGGNDTVNAGAGTDTVRLPMFPNVFSLSESTLGHVIGSYAGNTLTLNDVENVQFGTESQTTIPLSRLVSGEAQLQLGRLTDLYLAFFGRAPDVSGLEFWQEQLLEIGKDFTAISKDFAWSPEAQALFPQTGSNRDFVHTVYANCFGREPDPGGWDYWTSVLDAQGVTDLSDRGVFVGNVILGAYATSSGPEDRTLMTNRHEAALYYVNKLAIDPAEGFDAAINTLLAKVTGDASTEVKAEHLIDYAFTHPVTLTGVMTDAVLRESIWGA